MSTASSNSAPKRRKNASDAWNHFELIQDGSFQSNDDYKRVDRNYKDFCPTVEEWNDIESISWQIQSLLIEESKSKDLFTSSMAKRMQLKFDKYWVDCNIVLAIAVVLDPRYKMKVVEFAYIKIYGNRGLEKVNEVRAKLKELLEAYIGPSSQESSLNDLPGNKSNVVSLDEDPYSTAYDTFQSQDAQLVEKKSELDLYLQEPPTDRKLEVDVLDFWKQLKYRYPHLSQMARDILTVPISSVASEQAFSVGGRVLTPIRSSLSHDSVEALICSRSWLYGLEEKVYGEVEGNDEDHTDIASTSCDVTNDN